jgi:PncC family amidohydrolase
MNAIILSVGDELTLGQVVDTNSAWLSQQLASIGLAVSAHVTVPDDQPAIEHAIRSAAARCTTLIISGGIGPTPDDLTRQALAAVLNQPLELDELWLVELHKFFLARGRAMPDMNRIQAMIPRGATLLWNHNGTAAGIHAVLRSPAPAHERLGYPSIDQLQGRPVGRVLTKMGRITREQLVEALNHQKSAGGLLGQILVRLGHVSEPDLAYALDAQRGIDRHALACDVYVVPGVPKEMKLMFEKSILPNLSTSSGGGVILSRSLHTYGLGESAIAELLGPLMDRSRNPTVGTTVSAGIVSVRINSRFPTKDEAQRQLSDTERLCCVALGPVCYGADDDSLPQVVGGLLKSLDATVATAESCTGGLLAKYLTDVSGSSAWFKYGWVTYANEAKIRQLDVPADTLLQHGAVSEQTVAAMARGALDKSDAHFALAISGIAGPGGGTPAKPVGTVCIALADPQLSEDLIVSLRTFLFYGDREMIRDRSAKTALAMLRFHLLDQPLPF